MFSLFTIMVMVANCAEIGSVDKFEAEFQQVPFLQRIFFNITVVKH